MCYPVLHCVVHRHPDISALYHVHMNLKYAGNKQIHFLFILHSHKTKNLLHRNTVWTPVLHTVLTKTSFPNSIHAMYKNIKHGPQKISPVWSV